MEDLELVVVKRAKDLTKGVFKVGTVLSLDSEDMVVYHKGLEWPVYKREDGRFALGRFDNGTELTILEIVA
ncbi:hypothetical protein EGD17_05365 [Salmonella enterica]|nr:hypothetical protein [Salmonella enterica]